MILYKENQRMSWEDLLQNYLFKYQFMIILILEIRYSLIFLWIIRHKLIINRIQLIQLII